MYNPLVGRFLEEDPIGFEAGDPNLDRYVGNSPTNATDPSGLEQPLKAKPIVAPEPQSKYTPQWVYENWDSIPAIPYSQQDRKPFDEQPIDDIRLAAAMHRKWEAMQGAGASFSHRVLVKPPTYSNIPSGITSLLDRINLPPQTTEDAEAYGRKHFPELFSDSGDGKTPRTNPARVDYERGCVGFANRRLNGPLFTDPETLSSTTLYTNLNKAYDDLQTLFKRADPKSEYTYRLFAKVTTGCAPLDEAEFNSSVILRTNRSDADIKALSEQERTRITKKFIGVEPFDYLTLHQPSKNPNEWYWECQNLSKSMSALKGEPWLIVHLPFLQLDSSHPSYLSHYGHGDNGKRLDHVIFGIATVKKGYHLLPKTILGK